MPSQDYIPPSEGAFDGFQGVYVDYAVANLAGVLPPAMLAELAASKGEWEVAYPAHGRAKAAAREAAQLKREARARLTRAIRDSAAALQANPAVGPEVLRSLQLRVRDTERTPAQVPSTWPLLVQRLARSQTILLGIIDAEGKTRKKPKGVFGCQIFVDVGDATPADRESFRYLGLATDGKFEATFAGEDVGKFAHFYGRWMNTRGELGPYGPILTMVVPN